MKIRDTIAALMLTAVLPVAAACGTATAEDSGSSSSSTSSTSTTDTGTADGGPGGGGGPGGVEVSSVATEDDLISLVQEAYGDGGLGLHRGHQPIEDVLDEVLQISHDELHVRMEEEAQNLATVAEDLGIDPQTLVDALVEKYSAAIDTVLASGEITDDEADRYRAALDEAFTWRITWDGEEATPTFDGLDG